MTSSKKRIPYISYSFNENDNFMFVESNDLPYLMSYDYTEIIVYTNIYIKSYYDNKKKLFYGKVYWD